MLSSSHSQDSSLPLQDAKAENQLKLRQALKEFLVQASAMPPQNQLCPRCRRPVEYVDTVFRMYGDADIFRIPLPVCACMTPGS